MIGRSRGFGCTAAIRRRKFRPSYHGLLGRRERQRVDLRQLDARMQPWPVRAEQDLARAGAADRLIEQIEAANAGRIGVNIGMTDEEVDQRQLRAPVVGKAAEMGNDESDVGILLRQQLHDRDFAHHVVEHGKPECACHLAHLAADPAVVAMKLDPDESVALDRKPYHRLDPTAVALRMNKGKAVEAIGVARDDPRHFTIGDAIVGMEGSKQHRAVDARERGAAQIRVQWSGRIPRAGEAVAVPRMAMAVDDHGGSTRTAPAARPRARSSR